MTNVMQFPNAAPSTAAGVPLVSCKDGRDKAMTIPAFLPKPGPSHNPCEACLPTQEAHHRIANHFALLGSYVHLRSSELAKQVAEPDRRSVLLLLDSIRTQINTVAQVHRLLATVGHGARLDIGTHLHDVLAHFTTGTFGSITLKEDLAPGYLIKTEHSLPIAQIVAEVVTNSIKHAGRDDLTVSVSCHRIAGGRLLIEIADNGPGYPAAAEPAKAAGIGLRLLHALAAQLMATVEFSSNAEGLKFHLVLPPQSLL